MIPAKQLIAEVVSSLRNVIAPAVSEPFQKSQAYMAAVVLEFVARQVDERSDIAIGEAGGVARTVSGLAAIARREEHRGDRCGN